MDNDEQKAVYLYCVAKGSHKGRLGNYGIKNSPIYTIPYENICAIVHDCRPEPYKTEDEEEGRRWVLSHQYVLDLATAKFGTIIPLTFDTIFTGGPETVKNWLHNKYESLFETLHRLRGKEEYGVEVLIEKKYVRDLVEKDGNIMRMREEISVKPEGFAYMLGKRLARDIKLLEEEVTRSISRDVIGRIKEIIAEVKIVNRKARRDEFDEEKETILNLSCLGTKDEANNLGALLGKINGREEITIRFTGPWPPYSFVTFPMTQ